MSLTFYWGKKKGQGYSKSKQAQTQTEKSMSGSPLASPCTEAEKKRNEFGQVGVNGWKVCMS